MKLGEGFWVIGLIKTIEGLDYRVYDELQTGYTWEKSMENPGKTILFFKNYIL